MFEVPEVCPVDDGTDWVQVAEFGPTTPAVIVTVILRVAAPPMARATLLQVTVPAVFVGVQAPAGVIVAEEKATPAGSTSDSETFVAEVEVAEFVAVTS